MLFTKNIFLTVLLAIFLTACAQIETQDETNTEKQQENITSAPEKLSGEELKKYKTALYAMRDNNMQTAKELLTEIVSEYPNLSGPKANLGLVYFKEKNSKKAQELLTEAIRLNNRNAYAHNTLASIQLQQGDFINAEKHFLLALKFKPDYAKAHFNIALLYDVFFHKISESISHYKSYLSLISKKGMTDQKTVDWVKHLENSLKQG